MLLTRWTPRRELAGFQDEFNQLFEDLFARGSLRPDAQGNWIPPVDIHESEEGFAIQLDLPGVQPKDVKINLVGETLAVRGERRSERTEGEGGARRIERFTGFFERTFTLGAPMQADKIRATYRDGVLEIYLPKAEEARSREISIEVQK
jgi:HSP20 family protein